jgi:4-carboxymuconolactone decarboxylase
MADKPHRAPQIFRDIAPAMAEYTDEVLFGEVWASEDLTPRERSLVTVTCLISLYRTNELPFHLKKALENGVSKKELGGLITHLAFYAGWPAASTAIGIADRVFREAGA